MTRNVMNIRKSKLKLLTCVKLIIVSREKDTTEHFNRLRRQVMEIYQTWVASPTSKVSITTFFVPTFLMVLVKSIVVSRSALETFLERNRTWISNPTKSEKSKSPSPPDSASSSDKALEINLDRKDNTSSSTDTPDPSLYMTDIACEHGRLDPHRAPDMKCIDSVRVQVDFLFCVLPFLDDIGKGLKLLSGDFSCPDNR
jgi:hypothetical protein